jgi:ribosomal protein S17E
MNEIPDTLNYMIAGYILFGAGILGYITSLVVRWKKIIRQKNEQLSHNSIARYQQ